LPIVRLWPCCVLVHFEINYIDPPIPRVKNKQKEATVLTHESITKGLGFRV